MNLSEYKVYEHYMKEESKEDYLARIRKEQGRSDAEEAPEEPQMPASALKTKLKSVFTFLLFVLFIYFVYVIFGMLKAN